MDILVEKIILVKRRDYDFFKDKEEKKSHLNHNHLKKVKKLSN